jgi:tRNA A37 threonylcarbamoyladenosine biosynthesis protein TsaE
MNGNTMHPLLFARLTEVFLLSLLGCQHVSIRICFCCSHFLVVCFHACWHNLCCYVNSKELEVMEKVAKLPSTVIAVVGDTGSGKSSLLNALLDHAGMLPTSGVRACTAVVVMVSENTSSDLFEADIEFLQEREWTNELQLLLKELTSRKTGLVRTKQPDPDSEALVAWSKIRAVYGPFNKHVSLSYFMKQRSVTKWLGKKHHIHHRSVS